MNGSGYFSFSFRLSQHVFRSKDQSPCLLMLYVHCKIAGTCVKIGCSVSYIKRLS